MNKRKTATGRKAERKEDNVAQSALTSPYNMLIPLYGAAHVWLTHPVTRKTLHLSTTSPAFFAVVTELFALGVGERIMRELNEFAEKYDPAWTNVAAAVTAHLGAGAQPAEESVTVDA